MTRPSRLDEAKEKLRAYYAEHGGMPSIQVFAELMGYASASSAHDVSKLLVDEEFLVREERGGRLLPGPKFGHELLPELRDLLPPGVPVRAFPVMVNDLAEAGVLQGDTLVLAPADRTDPGELMLWRSGKKLLMAVDASKPWKAEGVVVAQFRKYR